MTPKTLAIQTNQQIRHTRGLLASFFLCLSLGAGAQNYYTGPNSPIHTFGQKYAQAGQVVDQQSRMVFYRTRQSSSVPGAASVYVNGAYHASIIPGGYSQLCMPPGSVELGLKSVEVGTNVKDNLDTITAVRSASAQTQFFRVQEAGRGRQVLQPVQAAEALREIDSTREQTHTISRVTGAVECSINRNPAPAAPQTITLAADALFAFGRADLGAMSATGRASLDALVSRLRSEYIQLDRMNIIGHADPLGQPGPNERLSIDRAYTVQQYLSQAGLGNVRMTSEGRGDREPVAQCGRVATPQAIACNAPNRRVVIDIAGARR